MKKMTYLMMLVLGLTAVNRTQAGMIKNKVDNTKEMVHDTKEADGFGGKVKAVTKSVAKGEKNIYDRDTKGALVVANVM